MVIPAGQPSGSPARLRAGRAPALAACLFLLTLALPAQTVYTYVGSLSENSVVIAWGTATGGSGENTIGRDSRPMGRGRVRIGGQTVETDRNWAEIRGLQPDTPYPYEVEVDGRRVGGSVVRTWAARAQRMAFFVIGDFGNGSSGQRAIAQAMQREFERRAGSDNPVRFVITVGDNIYADLNLGYFSLGSGDEDRHWDRKYFAPYSGILAHIPFYPTLGNHDGNESESRGDLGVYLDNFSFPRYRPARWYDFIYGGLAHFFALDSTDITATGHTAPAFGPEGDQSRWLAETLPTATAPWKIPFMHNPPFNAGPGHGASYNVLRHWVELFQKTGIRVVFTGHEHNFQVSEASQATGNIRYFVTGSGGELRRGNVTRNMERSRIEGWAPQRQFLVVEIENRTMRVTPISNERMFVRDRAGRELPMPVTIQLPQ